jgi:phage-related protein
LFFDAESIAIFFKTLAVILNGIVTLLDNDVAKAIISGIGALVAFGLAIGLLQTIFGFFGKVLLGAMANMVRLFSVIMPSGSAAAATLRGAMTALAAGNIAAAAPILIVVAAIVALVAIFKLAWDNSEKFRDAVKELAEAVGGALKEGMEKIKTALGDVGASTENLREIFKKIGDFLGTYIVPFFKEVFVLAIGIVVDVIVGLIKIVKGLWDAFTNKDPVKAIKAIFDEVVAFVKSLIERVAKAFGFKISWAWLTDGLSAAVNLIGKGINKVSETLNKAITGFNKINPFKDIPLIPMIALPIKLAKGGIVPATPGGMLATIGEAGRPERVEPLDPDGLSKRDRAMIAMLSGGSGGVNITVNPSPGMDERELAALVSRQLAFQLRKGAA